MKGLSIKILGLLMLCGFAGCRDGGASLFRRGEVVSDSSKIEPVIDDGLMMDVESELAQVGFTTPVSEPEVVNKPTLVSLHSGDGLEEHLTSGDGPLLLDFHASWCAPCRLQGKILKDLESTAADAGTRIVKIDVDEHPRLARQFQVSSLPTLLMLEDGQVTQRQIGVTNKQQLVSWMNPGGQTR